jgi:hypothetical protein
MWIKSPPHFSDIDGNAVLEKYPNVSDLLSAPRRAAVDRITTPADADRRARRYNSVG